MFSAQQAFVSGNVADDLNARIPSRVLLDQKTDGRTQARREAARGQNRDFRLRVAWVGACGGGEGWGSQIWARICRPSAVCV